MRTEPQHLLVFGLGYTGSAIAVAARDAGFAVTGTSRDPGQRRPPEGVALIPYESAETAVANASHVVTTIPVGEAGDPVLDRYGGVLASSGALRWAGYLSTTGVYGDRGGGWVDEDTEPAPASPRTRRRRAAELAWGRRRLRGRFVPGRRDLRPRPFRLRRAPRRHRAPDRQAGPPVRPRPSRRHRASGAGRHADRRRRDPRAQPVGRRAGRGGAW